MEVESGERPVVGVNLFPSAAEPLEVFAVDPGAEAEQVAAVRRVRDSRDAEAVERALDELSASAKAGANVVPACVTAVEAYATVGEIVDRLREVHGRWTPTTAF